MTAIYPMPYSLFAYLDLNQSKTLEGSQRYRSMQNHPLVSANINGKSTYPPSNKTLLRAYLPLVSLNISGGGTSAQGGVG